MSASKNKGDKYERELAAFLSVRLGLNCHRAPLSGGGFLASSGGADLTGTPHLHIEAKRTERLNIKEALRQAQASLLATSSPDIPVVITRQNRMTTGESIVALNLDDFCTLYESHLKHRGFRP